MPPACPGVRKWRRAEAPLERLGWALQAPTPPGLQLAMPKAEVSEGQVAAFASPPGQRLCRGAALKGRTSNRKEPRVGWAGSVSIGIYSRWTQRVFGSFDYGLFSLLECKVPAGMSCALCPALPARVLERPDG